MGKKEKLGDWFNPFNRQKLGNAKASNVKRFEAYSIWARKFSEIAVSQFVWNNLPYPLNSRLIENKIALCGEAPYIVKENDYYYVLELAPEGSERNVYGEPVYARSLNPYKLIPKVYVNDLGLQIAAENMPTGIRVYDNFLGNPLIDTIEYYALCIADIECVIGSHHFRQTIPIVVEGDEDARLSRQTYAGEWEEGSYYVLAGNGFSSDVKMTMPDFAYFGEKLCDVKQRYINEFMQFLGIHVPQKKENYINDEIGIELEKNNAYLSTRLKSREFVCKRMNEVWDLNVSVEKSY